jgi:hypothetical protein
LDERQSTQERMCFAPSPFLVTDLTDPHFLYVGANAFEEPIFARANNEAACWNYLPVPSGKP